LLSLTDRVPVHRKGCEEAAQRRVLRQLLLSQRRRRCARDPTKARVERLRQTLLASAARTTSAASRTSGRCSSALLLPLKRILMVRNLSARDTALTFDLVSIAFDAARATCGVCACVVVWCAAVLLCVCVSPRRLLPPGPCHQGLASVRTPFSVTTRDE
jgi:hypothetical protein